MIGNYTRTEIKIVVYMYKRQQSFAEIGRSVGRTSASVRNLVYSNLAELGLEPRHRQWTPEQEAALIASAKLNTHNGITNVNELARITNHSVEAVRCRAVALRKQGRLSMAKAGTPVPLFLPKVPQFDAQDERGQAVWA